MVAPNDDKPAQGLPVNEMDRFWLNVTRDAVKGSIGALEEAAKQLISAVSLLQGIYFAAISFSNLRELLQQNAYEWPLILLFVSPIVLWLACLAFAVGVFVPKTYETNLNSPTKAKKTYVEIVATKHGRLKIAHKLLLAGFVPLAVAIVVYLSW